VLWVESTIIAVGDALGVFYGGAYYTAVITPIRDGSMESAVELLAWSTEVARRGSTATESADRRVFANHRRPLSGRQGHDVVPGRHKPRLTGRLCHRWPRAGRKPGNRAEPRLVTTYGERKLVLGRLLSSFRLLGARHCIGDAAIVPVRLAPCRTIGIARAAPSALAMRQPATAAWESTW
jgi:hypothetical protein